MIHTCKLDDSSGRGRRGQSVVIGFLLLAILLVTFLSVYQATVVPAHNAEVELAHQERVTEGMYDVRDAIHLVGQVGGQRMVTLDLGPTYPDRAIALNPPEPAGTLETTTAGAISLTVDGNATNLTKACGYGGSSVPTHELTYSIDYRELSTSPRIAYSHTALYKADQGEQVLVAEQQTLVTNRTITLVPLAGNYSQTTTEPATIKLVGGPRGEMSVNGTDSIRLTIPSRMNASLWRELLANQPAVTDVTRENETYVSIGFETGQNYTVSCYPIGIGEAPPTGVRTTGNLSS